MKLNQKHHTCWEKLLKYRSNSFILSCLSLSVCKASSPKKSSAHLTLPILLISPNGGVWVLAQVMAAIFHSHLQFYLDVTEAKPAKLKEKKKVWNQKLSQEVFIACLF